MTDNIAKAPLSISAIWSSKTYDGTTNVTDNATPTAIGFVSTADYATGMTESFVSPNAGSEATVVTGYTINDGNNGNNYQVTLHQGIGSIIQATAAVNVTPYNVTYD